jgi:hypothetical protein
MTDNYECSRSMYPQSENEYSPYTDKQYDLYINDINSGVYQNNGLSLVQLILQVFIVVLNLQILMIYL